MPCEPTSFPSSLVCPNQAEMCSGSVTADHTFSMGAAIRMVRRTANPLSSMVVGWLLVMLSMIVPFLGVFISLQLVLEWLPSRSAAGGWSPTPR